MKFSSVTDGELASVFGEICGAIEQFDGKLDGWVCFFDAVAYEPERFESVEDLAAIRPRGGGGTSFEAASEAMGDLLALEEVSCAVILTDGHAPFPSESASRGVPTLWLLTSDDVRPPWGRVAHLGKDGRELPAAVETEVPGILPQAMPKQVHLTHRLAGRS